MHHVNSSSEATKPKRCGLHSTVQCFAIRMDPIPLDPRNITVQNSLQIMMALSNGHTQQQNSHPSCNRRIGSHAGTLGQHPPQEAVVCIPPKATRRSLRFTRDKRMQTHAKKKNGIERNAYDTNGCIWGFTRVLLIRDTTSH